jgi:acyl-CoA synthetase (AMP-forming)/AMP-acid ligase II
MNFSYYASIHSQNVPNKVGFIERSPAKGTRRALIWREFNNTVNKVTNYLRNEFHIKKGDFVLHLQNNSLEWLITYHAIIRIGAIVVPLNFRFIGDDIKYAASVCKPVAFILGSEFLERVLPIKSELKSIKNYVVVGETVPSDMKMFAELERYSDATEKIQDMTDNEDLALMFTSGTTGKPKPVLHTHGSINAVAIGNAISFSVQKDGNYIGFFPLYHAGTMFYMSAYYVIGATGTLLTEIKDPKWIIETVAEEKGSDLMLVVPVAISLINAIKNKDIEFKNYDLSSWKMLEIGAQPIPFDILRDLTALLPCKVIVGYGITEGGGGSTIMLHHEDVLKKPGSIGKPNFCVQCQLVDEKGDRALPGMVGEITLKTPRNMKGYYKNPELTAQTIKDGYLYTGDLARMDEDNYYYIVDRKKDLIICGGENIYPVEIEEVLHDHPKIEDAAVIGFPDERLVEIVMAIVQLKEGESATAEEIIEFCKSRLAQYKIPRKVVFDKIPRNPTGKISKPELRGKYTGNREVIKKRV